MSGAVHMVVHVLGRPPFEMQMPLSTPIHEMLTALFLRINFPLQRVIFDHRALPLAGSTMSVPCSADLERPLAQYGFARGAGPDHLHVLLQLGHDPRQTPERFSYDHNTWFGADP